MSVPIGLTRAHFHADDQAINTCCVDDEIPVNGVRSDRPHGLLTACSIVHFWSCRRDGNIVPVVFSSLEVQRLGSFETRDAI
jgi:hypothetical protein